MANDLLEAWVGKTLNPLYNLGDLVEDEVPEAYLLAHWLEGLAKAKREALRRDLIEWAQGEPMKIERPGFDLEVDHRKGPVKEAKLLALLKAKGIDPSEVFDTVQTRVFNEARLDFLVAMGRVTETEVADLRDKVAVISVKKSPEVTKLLEGTMGCAMNNSAY